MSGNSHRLPCQRLLFGIWYGSFTPGSLADFRTRGPFSAYGTEVLLPDPMLTSVPEATIRHLARKFYSQTPCRLPCQRALFGIWHGSFTPGSHAGFRARGLFSAFGTEVLLPDPMLTSVPEGPFRDLARKSYTLDNVCSLEICCRLGLPKENPSFYTWAASTV